MKLSCVYVICAENGEPPVKVGFSKNLRKRLSTFNVAAQKKLHVFFSKDVDDPRAVEKEAHAILSEHRLNGEWFNVDGETAKAAVLKASKISEAKPRASEPVRTAPPRSSAIIEMRPRETIRWLGPRAYNSTPVLSVSIGYRGKLATELLTFKIPATLDVMPPPPPRRDVRYIAIPLKVEKAA